MKGDDLAARFEALDEPESDAEIVAAKPLPGTSMRIAKVAGGQPALVLVHNMPLQVFGTRLRHIAYEPTARYSLANEASTVAVLHCRNADHLLRQYFFRVVAGLVAGLPAAPSFDEFDEAVRGTMALFDALTAPGTSTLQGVWSELFLVLLASDANRMIANWHDSPNDKYDFAAPPHRLEVKSTIGQLRIHRFALEQLDVAEEGETLVASLCLRRDDTGKAVNDLIEAITPRLQPQYQRKLERVVAQGLGQSWRDATELRFDQEDAHRSLRYYLACAIPSVIPDAGVTAVKFDVNLAELAPVPLATLPSCPLFAALPPPHE